MKTPGQITVSPSEPSLRNDGPAGTVRVEAEGTVPSAPLPAEGPPAGLVRELLDYLSEAQGERLRAAREGNRSGAMHCAGEVLALTTVLKWLDERCPQADPAGTVPVSEGANVI